MRADPLLATTIQVLVDDFKAYAATDPGEQQLMLEQRILEAKIHDLQQEKDMSPKEKTGMMMDRVVDSKNLERLLKDNKTPIEFLISVYSDTDLHMDHRLKAATSCLQYVHRKLPAAVEHTVETSGKVKHNMTIEFVEAKAIEGDVVMVERVSEVEDGEWTDPDGGVPL